MVPAAPRGKVYLPNPKRSRAKALGDHTCLGAGIAEIQVMVIMATIFHDYQLELDPPTYTLKIEHEPTAAPSKDFRVKVVARRGRA